MKTIEAPVSTRGKIVALLPDTRQSLLTNRPGLCSPEDVLAFQFLPLVHRMVDKHGWTEDKASLAFHDLKCFMYIAAESDRPVAPSIVIDEIWHEFILFTREYGQFCSTLLGRFIHHVPKVRGDANASGPDVALLTLGRAVELFGPLSDNWKYKSLEKEVRNDCITCISPSCSSCGAAE